MNFETSVWRNATISHIVRKEFQKVISMNHKLPHEAVMQIFQIKKESSKQLISIDSLLSNLYLGR